MTSLASSSGTLRSSLPLQRARGWLLAGLMATLTGACGAQSLSTDTGNPPVIVQKLRITESDAGVLVTGAPGAVPGGAWVDVVNAATGQSAGTQAAPDGSFEVELAGAVTDEFRVYVSAGRDNWRTLLTSAGASTPQRGLDGRDFRLSSLGVNSALEHVPGTILRFSFAEGQLTFNAGCNTHSGAYSLCEDRLCVSSLITTDMACPSERQEQDAWLASYFAAGPQLNIDGPVVAVGEPDAALYLLDREAAPPDLELTGRVWEIYQFWQGKALLDLARTDIPFVEFRADQTFRVFTICNIGEGTYARQGNALTLSPVAYQPLTELGCDEANLPAERQMQEVLGPGQVGLEIDFDAIYLTRGSAGLGGTPY